MRIGLDLGGTKIEGVLFDASGAELARRHDPTPKDHGSLVSTMALNVRSLETEAGTRCSVGVCTPGATGADGMLRNAHNTPSNGRPLKADLELALKRELRLANDADCFALSEASDGAAKDATLVFGVILGTGCGGGIVSNGRLLTGVNGLCGEWGHNPLPWMLPDEYPGPRCYCGRDGCIEQFIAGPGLARDHLNATGNGLTVLAIADGAAAGEASCCATVDRHVHRVARALASVVNVLDPEVIVLGGGVSSLDYLYERVPQLWGDYVFGGRVKTRLVKNLHGAASGVRGAAWLWSADAA